MDLRKISQISNNKILTSDFITWNRKKITKSGFFHCCSHHIKSLFAVGEESITFHINMRVRISDPEIYCGTKVWLRSLPFHILCYTASLCASLCSCHLSLHIHLQAFCIFSTYGVKGPARQQLKNQGSDLWSHFTPTSHTRDPAQGRGQGPVLVNTPAHWKRPVDVAFSHLPGNTHEMALSSPNAALCKSAIQPSIRFKRYKNMGRWISKLTFFKRSFWRNVFLAVILESFGRIKTFNTLNCT